MEEEESGGGGGQGREGRQYDQDEDYIYDHNNNNNSYEGDEQLAHTGQEAHQGEKVHNQPNQLEDGDDDRRDGGRRQIEDELNNSALPEYQHPPSDFVGIAFEYFSSQVIKHFNFQTNENAAHKDINTTFNTTEDEVLNLVAVLNYMVIAELPSVHDYRTMHNTVCHVTNLI